MVGILNETGTRRGVEIGRQVTVGIEIAMVEETSAVERTVGGRDGTWAGDGSTIRAAVIVTAEISRTVVVEMEQEQVVTNETDMIVATATGTLAEVKTETTTEMVESTTATDPVGTERRIAIAAMDHRTPAEVSVATISQNEAHGGVHRRTLNHLSPSMFDRLIRLVFLDHHQMQATRLTCRI